MYIEQAKQNFYKNFLYLPIPLCFIALMIVNYIFTKDVDSEQFMKELIAESGVNGAFVELIAPLSIACILIWIWVKYAHRQSLTSLTTSRPKVDWSRIFFAFFVWGTITVAITLFDYFLYPKDYVFNFKPEKFLVFLALGIVLIPLQTSFEEYLFRGYIMQGLGNVTKSRAIPFLFTSILFGLMHIANPEVEKMGLTVLIYYIGTGFFLGILTLMDEGLELSLGFHAANNLIGALLVTADWSAFQTHSILKDVSEPTTGFEIILPIFIVFPILLYVFGKKYNWNWSDWKQKLFGKIIVNQINKIETSHDTNL